MSLPVIQAVHKSQLEPRLRHLAQTLAVFARDDGSEIRPGAAVLMRVMGIAAGTLREGLQTLISSGVLVRDGFHGHTRRFRFDLERLASYQPKTATRSTWRAAHLPSHQQPVATATPSKPSQPVATATPSVSETCRHGGANLSPRRREGVATAALTCRHGGAIDLNDLKDLNELTTADAVGHAVEKINPSPTMTPPADANPGAEKAAPKYSEIAIDALAAAVRERDESPGNLTAHFIRLCTARGLPCDDALTRTVIDAAIARRDSAAGQFFEKCSRVAGRITRAREGG